MILRFSPVIGTDWLHLLPVIVIILYYDVGIVAIGKNVLAAHEKHTSTMYRVESTVFFFRASYQL